jgi:hypothetical protein
MLRERHVSQLSDISEFLAIADRPPFGVLSQALWCGTPHNAQSASVLLLDQEWSTTDRITNEQQTQQSASESP